MSMIHARDRATPENKSKVPGTFFSHGELTLDLSAKIAKPMIIKITEIIAKIIKMVVENI